MTLPLPMLANVVTTLLCIAVLVQSVRMMRALKVLRDGPLTEMVGALDASTGQAKAVLTELKVALTACSDPARKLEAARAIAEELGVLVGIADATAERLVAAADAANRAQAALPAPARVAAVRAAPRTAAPRAASQAAPKAPTKAPTKAPARARTAKAAAGKAVAAKPVAAPATPADAPAPKKTAKAQPARRGSGEAASPALVTAAA